MRKIKLNTKTQLVTVNKKLERREAKREEKAVDAANIENAIKKEILARFNSNTYPEDIHNFNPKLFEKALEEEDAESDQEEEPEIETVEEFIEDDLDDLEDEGTDSLETVHDPKGSISFGFGSSFLIDLCVRVCCFLVYRVWT